MWRTLILAEIMVAVIIYLMLPKQHCVCGVTIPEGGGVCKWCGEYNHRMIVRRDRELKRIEEEESKGNSYYTFL